MKIGQAAATSGVTVKAIRHYEAEGLLGKLPRRGRYREFSAKEVEQLRLIAHCRALELGVSEIRRVVRLVEDSKPECPAPEAMLEVVDGKLHDVRAKIRALREAETRLVEAKSYLERRRASRVS